MKSFRLTCAISMWSGPRHSPVPVIARPENSEPVTFPKTCRGRGLKAKLCDPSP